MAGSTGDDKTAAKAGQRFPPARIFKESQGAPLALTRSLGRRDALPYFTAATPLLETAALASIGRLMKTSTCCPT